jgi:Tfp pilus assembly protein PilX
VIKILQRLRGLDGEAGIAMGTAMMVMALMAVLGAATISLVSTQSLESGKSRTRESTFNLTEGVMNGQIMALSKTWPGSPDGVTPPASSKIYGTCTQATTDARCPVPTDINAMYRNIDTSGTVTWKTNVYDNSDATGSRSFYNDTTTPNDPGWDQNDDGKLWIRAQATVRGRPRTLVALVNVQKIFEQLPRVAVVAGSINITNNGKKVMIDANGVNNGAPALIAVRCSASTTGCMNSGKPDSQLEPNDVQYDYPNSPMMSDDALQRMHDRAEADGTLYTSCAQAQTAGLTGAVVYIELATDEACSFGGNTSYNTPENPGLVIINRGTLSFGGTSNYYGVVYHLNQQGSSGTVVSTQGNSQITGGIMVDGLGRVDIGSSKANVVFDERAALNVRSYGTAGIVQNSWREIKPAF